MPAPLRVAAYCRVSTDREDQAGSLQSQQAYFHDYISRHPGWTLVEVYADEGLSGTSTRRRTAFHRMIRDAQAGRVDLILTKEVSRFARNTVDALAYTRELKARGVGVLFLTDHIDTRDGDGELRLTLMASIAQEESRKTSERVKWGQRRRMEAGVVFGNDTLYGFRLLHGVLSIDPEEAAVVRHIYHKFLAEGKGTCVIARELTQEGVPPPRAGGRPWSPAMVRRVLTGEKYVGDVRYKKRITADHLTHKQVPNRGQEEQLYLRDHHPAIIDRPTWEAVQAELARRADRRSQHSRHSARSWCSGRVRCGLCGSVFVLRSSRRRDGTPYRLWGCSRRVRSGAGGCPAPMVNERVLDACAQFLLEGLGLDWDRILADLARRMEGALSDPLPLRQAAAQRRRWEEKKAKLLEAFSDGVITREELLPLKERCDRALARLPDPAPSAAPLPPLDGLRPTASREVYRAVIRAVTVWPDRLEFQLAQIPGLFRLWYTTHGAGSAYTTRIYRWDRVDGRQESS